MCNNLFKTLIFLLMFSPKLVVASQNIYEKHPLLYISPQFGIETSSHDIQFVQDKGHSMFEKVNFPTTVFFNVKCNDTFGVEIGYTFRKKKSRDDIGLYPGELRPGSANPIAFNNDASDLIPRCYSSTIELRKPYIGLKYDLHFHDKKPYLFGMVGATQVQARAVWERTNVIINDTIANRRIFEVKKIIPFIKLGVYVPIPNNDHFSIRLAATWFKTSKLKGSTEGNNPQTEIAAIVAKNKMHFSLGLAYNI